MDPIDYYGVFQVSVTVSIALMGKKRRILHYSFVKTKESSDGTLELRPGGWVDLSLLEHHSDVYPEQSSLYVCVSVF